LDGRRTTAHSSSANFVAVPAQFQLLGTGNLYACMPTFYLHSCKTKKKKLAWLQQCDEEIKQILSTQGMRSNNDGITMGYILDNNGIINFLVPILRANPDIYSKNS